LNVAYAYSNDMPVTHWSRRCFAVSTARVEIIVVHLLTIDDTVETRRAVVVRIPLWRCAGLKMNEIRYNRGTSISRLFISDKIYWSTQETALKRSPGEESLR